MSQEEPHIELRAESFLQCHQYVCQYVYDLSRIRISNNVENSEHTKGLHVQQETTTAFSLSLLSHPTQCLSLILLSLHSPELVMLK